MQTFKLSVHVEVSDHTDYCSGAECEYSSELKTIVVRLDDAKAPAEGTDLLTFDWSPFIKSLQPDIHGESFYCENSPEAESAGLGIHDSRLTVVRARRVRRAALKALAAATV